jgi:hypothetical protein
MPITQFTFRDGDVSTYCLEHQCSIPGKGMAFSSNTLIYHLCLSQFYSICYLGLFVPRIKYLKFETDCLTQSKVKVLAFLW